MNMGDKKIFYFKMVLAQVVGYIVSVLLVQKVFLGPAPVVRAEFMHDVQQLPYTTRDYFASLPVKIKRFVAEKKLQKEIDTRNPPPWVFEPLPGEVLPTDRTRPTQQPTSQPDIQPTNPPAQPPPDEQKPNESQPTAQPPAPRPTRPSVQPTSAPANPSTLEQQVVQIINQRRREAGLNELSVDGYLSNAARGHSQYISGGRGRCGHIGQGGSSPLDRARTAGYRGQIIGETVACGYTTAQTAVDGWWSSPPHKAVLMTPAARQIGMGWANNYQTALVAR